MAIEIVVKKFGDGLLAVSEHDIALLEGIKAGQGFKVKLTRLSNRSLKHHGLYWAGLLPLIAQYWSPEEGSISKYDRKIMSGLIDWVGKKGYNTEATSALIDAYLDDRSNRMVSYFSAQGSAKTNLQAIHQWLKLESGYYDLVITPTGPRKEVKSINFNAMSQEEFYIYYKKAFGVAWNYVFSKNNFKTQQEAEQVALEMSEMG